MLLVSGTFLASEFIAKNELPPLLKAAEEDGALVVPVIVSPCRYDRTEGLQDFHAANPPSRTLEEMDEAEWKRTLLKVANRIEDALKDDSS